MEQYLRRIFISENEKLLVQFFRYAIVGGTSAFVDISIFYMTAGMLGINHITANTLSFIFGLLVNYFLGIRWVFNKQDGSFVKDFALYGVIGFLGLILSNFILYMLINLDLLYKLLNLFFSFNNEDFIKFLAKLIAVFIVLFWNFIARKIIIFR